MACTIHCFENTDELTKNSVVPRFGARGGGGLPPKKFGNPGERLRKKKWDLSELPKFEKNFYVEHPEVARLTPVSLHVYFNVQIIEPSRYIG